jgi:hypothetical protein
MKTKILLIVSMLFFSGCYENSINNFERVDYSIDQKLSCFCPGAAETVRLFVREDSIVNAINTADKSCLAKEEWNRYRTIKGLFDEIANHDTSIFTVNVTYDPVHHFPSYIYVNPKPVKINDTVIQVAADADFSYTTSNYTEYRNTR